MINTENSLILGGGNNVVQANNTILLNADSLNISSNDSGVYIGSGLFVNDPAKKNPWGISSRKNMAIALQSQSNNDLIKFYFGDPTHKFTIQNDVVSGTNYPSIHLLANYEGLYLNGDNYQYLGDVYMS